MFSFQRHRGHRPNSGSLASNNASRATIVAYPCLFLDDCTLPVWQEIAALRDFDPAFDPILGPPCQNGIIPLSSPPQTSNNIIQKGLAFGREQSGTVTVPGARRASGSCPAGCMAEVGLWWWRNDAAPTQWRIPMARLTDTQLVILSSASRRNDRGVDLPTNVTGEAVRKAVDKLIRTGLLEEVRANGSLLAWRRDAEAGPMALRITPQGLKAIGMKDVAVRQALARLPTGPKWKHLQSRLSPLASGLPLQRRRPFARGITRAMQRAKPAPRAKAGQGRNKLAWSPC